MKSSINLSWKQGMAFESELNGHKITIDANKEVGGEDKGPRPKQLMLLALAGCTGMDVVSMLRKMKVNTDRFEIEVEADMTEEHPKHYYKMHVIYKIWGVDLAEDKIRKAVSLSDEKYCGVSVVYKKALELTHEVRINP